MTHRRYLILCTILWLVAGPWLLLPTQATALTVAALLVLLASRLGSRRWGGYGLRPTWMDGFVAVYLLLVALAYLVSPLPALSLPKFTAAIWGAFGYFLAQDWLETPQALRRFAVGLGLAGVGLALLGLVVVAWPTSAQVVDLRFLYRRLPQLGLVHRNEMAGLQLLLLPFVVAWWRWSPAGWRRWLALAGLSLFVVLLLFTQARAVLLSGVAMLAAWWLWGRLPLRRVGLAVLALLLVLVVGLGVVVSRPGAGYAQLLAIVSRLDAGSKTDLAAGSAGGTAAAQSDAIGSWTTRLELWRAAGQMLADYPALGAGLYTFYPVAKANYVFQVVGFDSDLRHAHNLWLQAGASFGWPGVLLFGLWWGLLLAALWQTGRAGNSRDWPPLARLWGVSLVGFLAYGLVDVVTLGHRTAVLVWLVLAGAAVIVRETRSLTRPGWALVLAPPLLLLLLLPFWPRNLAYIRLDRVQLAGSGHLPAAASLAGDSRRLGLRAFLEGDDAAALAAWQGDAAARADAGDAGDAGDAAQFAQGRGFQAHRARDLATAERFYSLAVALGADNSQVYYWRGLVRLDLADPAGAAADLAQAVRAAEAEATDDTWRALLHFQWGRALAGQADWAAALAQANEAIALDGTPVRYYELLGDVLTALGDPAGAAAAYERAGAGP